MKRLLLVLTVGCGYHSVVAAPTGKLHVGKVHSVIADASAAIEVEQGMREALAREGALAADSTCPCVHVEVTRIDHAAGAIVARAGDPAASSQITAIVGRATVDDGQGHTLFDTGDVRAETTYALAGADPALAEALRGSDALRAAARRLGRLLGARVLGHPAASEDAEGR